METKNQRKELRKIPQKRKKLRIGPKPTLKKYAVKKIKEGERGTLQTK